MKFLTQRHWYRILKLCASHLDYSLKLVTLRAQTDDHLFQRLDDDAVLQHYREFRGARVRIVRALTQIHVIIRIYYAVFADGHPQKPRRQIRDHLVRVHIRRRPGAALNDVHREVMMVFLRIDQLIARERYGAIHIIRQQPYLPIRHRARLLRQRHRSYEFRVLSQRRPRDVIIFHRSRRGDPVQRFRRYLHRSEQIALRAVRSHVLEPHRGVRATS